MVGAVKGIPVTITMPEKMSAEKERTMALLGARIIRTPTDVPHDHPASHMSVARAMCCRNEKERNRERYVMLDQYSNPCNPRAHEEGTAREILADCDGRLDMAVFGAGTGGTITGCAAEIKRRLPHCLVIGVDPVGSVLSDLAQKTSLAPPPAPLDNVTPKKDDAFYHVEGIGYDFLPDVMTCQQPSDASSGQGT